MADSIREQILKQIVTTLEGVTVANGYDFDMKDVIRIPTVPQELLAFPTAQVIDETEEVLDTPSHFSTRLLAGTIVVWSWDHRDISEAVNSILANTDKALMVDRTRGGLAISTETPSNRVVMADSVAPFGGVIIEFRVQYRFFSGDPFTQV